MVTNGNHCYKKKVAVQSSLYDKQFFFNLNHSLSTVSMLTKSEDDTQKGFCICNEQKKTILSNCVNIDSKTKGGQEKLYKASVFYSLLEKKFLDD